MSALKNQSDLKFEKPNDLPQGLKKAKISKPKVFKKKYIMKMRKE
jgi:hypothetical protein